MSLDITYWLYAPHGPYRPRRDPARCGYAVPDGGRSVTFHQCTRLRKDVVHGHGWCTQHAAKVRAWLARHKYPLTLHTY